MTTILVVFSLVGGGPPQARARDTVDVVNSVCDVYGVETARNWTRSQGYFETDLSLRFQLDYDDFLILADNFNAAGKYFDGDVGDCNGGVDLVDFIQFREDWEEINGHQTLAVSEPIYRSPSLFGVALLSGLLFQRSRKGMSEKRTRT